MPEVRIGLCGFTMSMQAYAKSFPVVEVQQTFYEPPSDASMRRWTAASGSKLEYTVKVWQLVTHPAKSPTYRRLKRKLAPEDHPGFFNDSPIVLEGWRRSVECATLLSATAMLFQCPASFTPEQKNVDRMRRFFERIERPPARLCWEPRGTPWLEQRQLALALCRDLDLVHVVDPFVTVPEREASVYWRLHGPCGAGNSYDDASLQKLRRMLHSANSPDRAYVFFNNIPRVRDAKRFVELGLDAMRGARDGNFPAAP